MNTSSLGSRARNRQRSLALGLASLAILGGCSGAEKQSAAPIVVEGIAYTLLPEKETYFVYEPLRFSLRVENTTGERRELHPALATGYELEILGSKEEWKGLVEQAAERDIPLAPGERRIVRLSLRDLAPTTCTVPGEHQVLYSYFGTSRSGNSTPLWQTPPVSVRYVEQPLVIPEDTSDRVAGALRELQESPSGGCSSSRPGWTSVGYNRPMRQLADLGNEAVPILLANIDNYKIQNEVIQLLGDLRAAEAVPQLLARLWMEDCVHDSLIIAALAAITQHPEGYHFHRRWFDEKVQKEALAAYSLWWAARNQPEFSAPKEAQGSG